MYQFKLHPNTVRGKAPDAYLYAPDKKEKKATDKDLFIMKGKEMPLKTRSKK